MEEGNCELCVNSCNSTTCECQWPDLTCWKSECNGTVPVGTECEAECINDSTIRKTFICEDANSNMNSIQPTISSRPNTGFSQCQAEWKNEGKTVSVWQIRVMGREECNGYCVDITLDLSIYTVRCQNWNNETMKFEDVTPDKVMSEGICVIECINTKQINTTIDGPWTYLCYPPIGADIDECDVDWHRETDNTRVTIDEIKKDLVDKCDDDITTSPQTPNTTTPPSPITTTPPPGCIGDCAWPPFNDPLGTWDKEKCVLICDPPPMQITDVLTKILPLNATW